jgi:hypothetical protein
MVQSRPDVSAWPLIAVADHFMIERSAGGDAPNSGIWRF